MGRKVVTIFLLYIATAAVASAQGEDNWPQFRGPGASGLAPPGAHLPLSWSTTQNVAWKVEIPGRGLSSPIVWGDRIFVTSCISEGKTPAAKKGLYFGGEQFKPPTDLH